MSALPDLRPLTGMRLSELSRCARMCAYRGLGAEAEEPDEMQRRYFSRGHLFTAYVAEQFRAKHGVIEREREIEWPHGTGHADIYVPSEKLLVEAKSSVVPRGASITDQAISQVKHYLRFDPEAETGAVYIVNPSTLDRERALPVILTDLDVARIDANVEAIGTALTGGPLPPRVCEKPGDAQGRFCPFASTCFKDWQEPDPITLDGEHAELARRLYDLDRRAAAIKADLKVVDEAKKTIAEMVRPLAPAGQECRAGQVVVKRTEVKGRVTYDTTAALAANIVTPEQMEPFRSEGRPHDRWKLTLEDASDDADEFGEEPPF